ncbi:MAG: hypothetical protein ABIS21_07685 [Acidimicrobiales bacterium]
MTTAPFLLAGLVLLLVVFLPPALAVLRPVPGPSAPPRRPV